MSQCIEHSCQTNSYSWLYHDPLLHVFLRPMICMHSFLFGFMTLNILCVVVLFFMPIFVLFVCSLSLVGCTSCVCVLSLPVQCWSLSYGKQRRPFRLCAPTWLRQQVWRTLISFPPDPSFVTAFSLFFVSKRIPVVEWHSASFQAHPIFSQFLPESEVPCQERKNFKSSPEVQVGFKKMQRIVYFLFLEVLLL